MRIFIGAIALALLAGCATPAMNEARTQPPYKMLSSNKPAQNVAQCIEFAWQDESVFGVDASAYKRTGSNGVVTLYTREGESFVDLRSQATGTQLSYYARHDNPPAKRRLAAVATCL